MGRPGAQDEPGGLFRPGGGPGQGSAHGRAQVPPPARSGQYQPWAQGGFGSAGGQAGPFGSPQPATPPGNRPDPDPPGRRKGRGLLWFTLSMVLLVAVAAGALQVFKPALVRDLLGRPGATASPSASPSPPPPVLSELSGVTLPTAEGLTAAIEALASDRRVGQLSASVVDVTSGEQLYDRNGQVPKVPASVNKVVTAAAVLAVRGPGHRLATRAVAGTEPGEVVLVGAGDPTLAVDARDTYPGAARLDKLAEQVKRNLGDARPTRVVVDSSVFTGSVIGPGWDSDITVYGYGAPITGLMVNGGRVYPKRSAPRSGKPDLAAGRAFAKLLGVPPDAVSVGQARKDATKLGEVESPNVLRLVEIMLQASDNVVAEALARQVALGTGAEASFEGAARATLEVLKELRLPVEPVRLADGSGLSRHNRLTTALLTELLAQAAHEDNPQLSGLFAGLPVAGYSGTLHDRFVGASGTAVGLVRAKTGTLNGVSSLAGVVPDADGRLLSFSLIANGVPGGAAAAEVVLDRIAAALAGCGCR